MFVVSKNNINIKNVFWVNAGQNCCVNSSMTDKFLEHEPQSTSTKNMIHLAQSKLLKHVTQVLDTEIQYKDRCSILTNVLENNKPNQSLC